MHIDEKTENRLFGFFFITYQLEIEMCYSNLALCFAFLADRILENNLKRYLYSIFFLRASAL